MALTAALWKNVFKGDPIANPTHVSLLAEYTRREVFNIMLVPAEDFYHGWIPWGPAPGETAEGMCVTAIVCVCMCVCERERERESRHGCMGRLS
jgi:hypothetical protein